MGIIGHKKRALIRRGHYIQEALLRRSSVLYEDNSEQLSLFDQPSGQQIKKQMVDIVSQEGVFKSKNFRNFILEGSGVYSKCSPEVMENTDEVNKPCVGKIYNDSCQTGFGIIGGNYSSESRGGVGEWSVINFFDTNKDIQKLIVEIYNKSNSNISLNEWVNVNIKDLVGDNGLYTKLLADKVLTKDSGTRFKGNQNEGVVIKVLERSFPKIIINRFCDGDERDRLNGQDLMVTYKNTTKYVQVKPLYGNVVIRTEIGGQVFFEISIYDDMVTKYSPENVQMLAFVNGQEYIIFDYVEGMYEQVVNTKSWGPKSPKFILRFKNDPKLKSSSLKISYVDDMGKIPENEKLKIFQKRKKYLETLIYDSQIKIKHLEKEIKILNK